MSTVKRRFPANPHLDVPKKQARELLQEVNAGSADAIDRVRRAHPRFQNADNATIVAKLKLSDAQFVIAREYNFTSWAQLKERIAGNTAAQSIDKAIRSSDFEALTQLLTANPNLLHIPVRSGNWGPPMSYAANMGLLEVVKVIAALGAKDFQHALERALLHGLLDIARWLLNNGASLKPGIIMGCCETLNDTGFGFLDDAGAPLTDAEGNRLAPLAMILETYSRFPSGKHAILRRFKARGYKWDDTPIMAFHCGDLEALKRHLVADPGLLRRKFSYREIYPPALGCADDNRSGLHGTPIGGTSLLHLAIDFDEREIFDWLIERGADVNEKALVDDEGFGGHTPIFNALVSDAYVNGRQRDAFMAKQLIDRGADLNVRVNLKKYLDWREVPGWHIAENVTAIDWARGFPEQDWVNKEALSLCTLA